MGRKCGGDIWEEYVEDIWDGNMGRKYGEKEQCGRKVNCHLVTPIGFDSHFDLLFLRFLA